MKKVCFLFLLFSVFSLGCREVTTEVDGIEIPDNAYYYQAYDVNGKFIVHGWFKLEGNDSDGYNGEWEFKALESTSVYGPQVGKGFLRGSKIGSEIHIELNPNMMDNNVVLMGKINGDIIAGEWNYYGFAGKMASGKFYAEKNNK